MTPLKINKAFKQAKCFKGTQTKIHILSNFAADAEILNTLTAKQLAAVINVANRSYHNGKSSCQAEIIDDCVWIGATVQKLIPLQALQALEITETVEETQRTNPNPFWGTGPQKWYVTHYVLNFKERH